MKLRIVNGNTGKWFIDQWLEDGHWQPFATCYSESDAAEIVRRYNAPEELIELLEAALPYIEEGEQYEKKSRPKYSARIKQALAACGKENGND